LRLGRYELLARLATGGMGEIFLARLEGAAGFEKLYVVKRILPHLADDQRFREMLVAEARVTSKMAHANICQVYELGETEGQLYIVMEYLEGITLLPLLRKSSKEHTPLDFGFIAGIVQQVTDALNYAHELKDRSGESLGIVHRDVTPSNIFLTESGVAKVLDFGIAKVKDASANTQTGTVKGKYAYMAPEQLRGGQIDRRVDVFALGIVLYEMIALRRLFQRKTDYLTFRAVMEQPMPDVRHYRPDVPANIAEVVMRALDREPDRRFATARQFGTALLDALGNKRPWSQGEIGDLVRANFLDDLNKRQQKVAVAIHRTGVSQIPGQGGVGRTTMPLIANDDAEISISDDDEDTEFPPVEETMDEMPVALRVAERHATANPHATPSDFLGHTPPPFGADSATSGTSLQPLTPPTVAAPPRRGVLMPMLVIMMVLITGGALVLVWRMMEKRDAPEQKIIVDTSPRPPDPTPGSAVEAGSGSAVASVTGSGSGRGSQKPTTQPHTTNHTQPTSNDAFQRALNATVEKQKAKLVDCIAKHGMPPVGTAMNLAIDTSGKLTSVSFTTEPDKRFAACVQAVMTAVSYPKPPVSWVQKVALRTR